MKPNGMEEEEDMARIIVDLAVGWNERRCAKQQSIQKQLSDTHIRSRYFEFRKTQYIEVRVKTPPFYKNV